MSKQFLGSGSSAVPRLLRVRHGHCGELQPCCHAHRRDRLEQHTATVSDWSGGADGAAAAVRQNLQSWVLQAVCLCVCVCEGVYTAVCLCVC